MPLLCRELKSLTGVFKKITLSRGSVPSGVATGTP